MPLKPVANPMGPIARELGAFSLVAVAVFSALSLVSLDLGRRPNLGGPIGYELAGSLHLGLGYQAYALVALTLALAQRIWSGARIWAITFGD